VVDNKNELALASEIEINVREKTSYVTVTMTEQGVGGHF
jgi:hypothetical protein